MKQELLITPKALAHLGYKKTISHIKTGSLKLSPPCSKEKSPEFSNTSSIYPIVLQKGFYFPSEDSQPNTPCKNFNQNQTQGVSRSNSFRFDSIQRNLGDIITVPDVEAAYYRMEKNRIEGLGSPNSAKKKNEKYMSRNVLEVESRNNISYGSNGNKIAEDSISTENERKTSRNSTEVGKNPTQNAKSKNTNTSLSQKSSSSNKSIDKLSKNYKIEQTPARVFQKEKQVHEIQNTSKEVIIESLNYSSPDHNQESIYISKPESQTFHNYLPSPTSSLRLAIPSSATLIPDTQIDILHDLTRTVKELSDRLIKSEEITYDRLRENKLLKSKIESLEKKINETENQRISDNGMGPLCHDNCTTF